MPIWILPGPGSDVSGYSGSIIFKQTFPWGYAACACCCWGCGTSAKPTVLPIAFNLGLGLRLSYRWARGGADSGGATSSPPNAPAPTPLPRHHGLPWVHIAHPVPTLSNPITRQTVEFTVPAGVPPEMQPNQVSKSAWRPGRAAVRMLIPFPDANCDCALSDCADTAIAEGARDAFIDGVCGRRGTAQTGLLMCTLVTASCSTCQLH